MKNKLREDDGKPKRIGILGGAFNPIHNGHLMIAENAREQFLLDQILFVPTGQSPRKHKRNITENVHRCAMVTRAISDKADFFLDEIEVCSPEISYTYRTIEKLKQKYISSKLFFILGADSLFEFESWRNPEIILKNCSILAAFRKHQRQEEFFRQISYLNDKYSEKFYPLENPVLEISSQEIRQRVKEGKQIQHLVPDPVDLYIKTNQLYQD